MVGPRCVQTADSSAPFLVTEMGTAAAGIICEVFKITPSLCYLLLEKGDQTVLVLCAASRQRL